MNTRNPTENVAIWQFTLPDSVRTSRRSDVVTLLRLSSGVNAMESTLRLLVLQGDRDDLPADKLARVHSVFAAISYLREIVNTIEKTHFAERLWALVDAAIDSGADIGLDVGAAKLLLSPDHPEIGGDVLLKVRNKVGFHWDPQPFEAYLDDPETLTVTIWEGDGRRVADRVFKSSADAMTRYLGRLVGSDIRPLLESCVQAQGVAGQVVEAAFIGLLLECGEDPANCLSDHPGSVTPSRGLRTGMPATQHRNHSSGLVVRASRVFLVILAALVVCEVALLLSGSRLLVSERRVEPGESVSVPDYGNLGSASQAQLVCKYFTGRGFVVRVLWYSPNNMFGRDECSFLSDEAE